MSDIAIAVAILSLVAVIGLWIGNWSIKGVGLGIGGVLFGGIIVGHFANTYGMKLDEKTLHFVREFGLILFVYTIGIQVGPGFFASLRSSGLKLNGFAALLVLIGCLIAAIFHKVFAVPLPVILGIFSGASTNTPSLGAGQQILTDLGAAPGLVSSMGMGYAVAYPFGICGILFSMWLVRLFFNIKVEEEADRFDTESGQKKESLKSINVVVQNPNLDGLKLDHIPGLHDCDVVCSRLKRGNELIVPKPDFSSKARTIFHIGEGILPR